MDAEIVLYLLWSKREEAMAIYLVNLIADCYTAQLMLSDKQILNQWQTYIRNRVRFLKSQENIVGRLQNEK